MICCHSSSSTYMITGEVTTNMSRPPTTVMNKVFQNADLMWIVVSYLTGYDCTRASKPLQRPFATAAPILPLLFTFRYLTRERMEEMGIRLLSLRSQFISRSQWWSGLFQ
mmetsp:Transcript_25232/g.42565  ORF Transcript_25232/g.42565 Transcript_25232/m.42565 type:complete len:110 (+) Transcript_25232:6-335(+)